MAPINNKNPNNINKKQTGTVPKTNSTVANGSSSTSSNGITTSSASKARSATSSSRKNTEIVAPTRRELNDLNDYLLSVSSEQSKLQNSSNNKSTGSGTGAVGNSHLDASCFELDNINFQETQRFCYPVRPIPRRNLNKKQQRDNNFTFNGIQTSNVHPSSFLSNNNNTNTNTISSAAAVGVVIPTTPANNINISSNIHQSVLTSADQTNCNPHFDLNSGLSWDERLNFIQYFLSLTSKPNNKTSENRAHSVSSIHTASGEPTTPNCDELQHRLEHSNRNIQNIKEQQQQLLRLQQAATKHLTDMEDVRNRLPIRFSQNGATNAPDYETVEQVHSDMSNLVNRMKNLQTFIHNQNELSSMLGMDSPDVLADQELLQKKMDELKSHRSEMKNLVSELQEINETAEQSAQNRAEETQGATNNRNVPIEFQRVVPIELIGSSKKSSNVRQNENEVQNGGMRSQHIPESDGHDDVGEESMDSETAQMIQNKVADINAMKSQLQRLKDMMATVKLIEGKTEGKPAVETGIGRNCASNHTKRPIQIPSSMQREFGKNFDKMPDQPSMQSITNNNMTSAAKDAVTIAEEQMMSERVRLLHEMTADLREQAVGLASERDRLKAIKEEIKRRSCSNSNLDKNSNNQESPAKNLNDNQQSSKADAEKDLLKAEYEAKKKEFEKICQRLQSEEDNQQCGNDDDDNENDIEDHDDEMKHNETNYFGENWQNSQPNLGSGECVVPPNATLISCNSSIHEKQSATTGANISRGKDSADSGAADVHGVASLEAGSMQSGSSRSFSMPPPMRTIIMNGNNRDIPWRKNSQDQSQAQYLDHLGPSMSTSWNPYYYNGYSPHFLQAPPHMNGANALPTAILNNDFICPHASFHNSGLGMTSASNVQNIANDPVLLQQFIQTQQMLINSVCQCNQLLWHQQREINSLNNTVVMLQERLLNSSAELPNTSSASIRADSVPPPLTIANNVYAGGAVNRAHSEQPLTRSTPVTLQPVASQQYQHIPSALSPNRPCYNNGGFTCNTNHHHHQHQYIRQHLQNNHHHHQHNRAQHSLVSNLTSAYNYAAAVGPTAGSSDHQIFQNTNTQLPPIGPHGFTNASPMPSTVTGGTASQNFLNNAESMNMQSSSTHSSAPPIFMHHHNNNIGDSNAHHPPHLNNNLNSNSNLLTSQQNCLNSSNTTAATNQIDETTNNSSAAAAAALNNQVPPGNRANNYWDNFRSYSRQNLLSSNSCKSNEEQNQQQQQQQQLQHMHQLPQQQQHIPPQEGIHSQHFNGITSGYRNPHHQQPPQPINTNNSTSGNVSIIGMTGNTTNNLSHMNYDGKYFHTFRNEFNSIGEPNQVNTNISSATNVPPVTSNHPISGVAFANIENRHLEVNQGGSASSNLSVNQSDNLNLNENVFDFNNTNANLTNNNGNSSISNNTNAATIFGSPDFRNMNFNFGVHDDKKVPLKTSCNSKRLRHTQSAPANQFFIDVNNRSSVAENMNQHSNMGNQEQGYNNTNSRYEGVGDGAFGNNETSEEIKRNLLVNALKNDKFTSKFFESLKEDVYRQAYAMIEEKKSDPQFLIQLFEELKGAPAYDPLRNMLVYSLNNLNPSNRSMNDTESNDGDNEMENFDGGDENNQNLLNSGAQPTQRYQNIENGNGASVANAENNRTDASSTVRGNIGYARDTAIMESLLNSKDMKMLAYKFMLGVNNEPEHQKNKIQDKKIEEEQHMSVIKQGTSTTIQSSNRPDVFIVNYVMAKIRKEIPAKYIDDTTVIRIAKMTVASLEDAVCCLGQKSIKIKRFQISPKEMYSKLKTFDKEDGELFLKSYQSYLTRIVNVDTNVNLAKPALFSPGSWSTGNVSHGRAMSSNNNFPWNGNNPQNRYQNGNGLASNVPLRAGDSKFENIQEHQQHPSINSVNVGHENEADGSSLVNCNIRNNHSENETGSSCAIIGNNMINEDLAEADQVCSAHSHASTIDLTVSGEASATAHGNSSRRPPLNFNELEPQNGISENKVILEHDSLGGNASMNEEDQDDAEAAGCVIAGAAGSSSEIETNTKYTRVENMKSTNNSNHLARLPMYSVNELENETTENSSCMQHKDGKTSNSPARVNNLEAAEKNGLVFEMGHFISSTTQNNMINNNIEEPDSSQAGGASESNVSN